jgi:hypothetical protein
MAEPYQQWFARWSEEMASGAGSGRVPGPEQATGMGVGGPRPGFKSHPRSKQRGRVPPFSAGQVKKL